MTRTDAIVKYGSTTSCDFCFFGIVVAGKCTRCDGRDEVDKVLVKRIITPAPSVSNRVFNSADFWRNQHRILAEEVMRTAGLPEDFMKHGTNEAFKILKRRTANEAEKANKETSSTTTPRT